MDKRQIFEQGTQEFISRCTAHTQGRADMRLHGGEGAGS